MARGPGRRRRRARGRGAARRRPARRRRSRSPSRSSRTSAVGRRAGPRTPTAQGFFVASWCAAADVRRANNAERRRGAAGEGRGFARGAARRAGRRRLRRRPTSAPRIRGRWSAGTARSGPGRVRPPRSEYRGAPRTSGLGRPRTGRSPRRTASSSRTGAARALGAPRPRDRAERVAFEGQRADPLRTSCRRRRNTRTMTLRTDLRENENETDTNPPRSRAARRPSRARPAGRRWTSTRPSGNVGRVRWH